MIKTTVTIVQSIENEKIAMVITLIKMVITTVIIV